MTRIKKKQETNILDFCRYGQ